MSEKIAFLTAQQPDEVSEDNLVPGSRLHNADCGHVVWIAPSSQGLMNEPGDLEVVRVQCTKCLLKPESWVSRLAMMRSLQENGLNLAPGTMTELGALLHKENLTAEEILEHILEKLPGLHINIKSIQITEDDEEDE